jgi:hypothetical protein
LCAVGQSAVIIKVEQPVLRAGESTTVTLWAGFPAHLHAMCCIETDLVTSVGSNGWAGPSLIPRMDGPGTHPGDLSATGVDGILAGQFHFPILHSYTDISNPIACWRATYTAPALVVRNIEIMIRTRTSEFWCYVSRWSTDTESHLAGLEEGAAIIQVIGCYADCDGSGGLDLFDFLCFQNMFAMGGSSADCDESGALDLFDFLCFQNLFAAGCQ